MGWHVSKPRGVAHTHSSLRENQLCVPCKRDASMDILLAIRDVDSPHCPIMVGKTVWTPAVKAWQGRSDSCLQGGRGPHQHSICLYSCVCPTHNLKLFQVLPWILALQIHCQISWIHPDIRGWPLSHWTLREGRLSSQVETYKCMYLLRDISTWVGNWAPITASENQWLHRVKRDSTGQMYVSKASSVLPIPTTCVDWISPGSNGRLYTDYMVSMEMPWLWLSLSVSGISTTGSKHCLGNWIKSLVSFEMP